MKPSSFDSFVDRPMKLNSNEIVGRYLDVER